MDMEEMLSDVLIIGGGAAASRAAYEAKRNYPNLNISLVTSGQYGLSGSSNLIASESLGINAPFNYMKDDDNCEIYLQDILTTGGGLSDPKLCKIIADEACDRVSELMDLDLKFDNYSGHPFQKKLSGCTKARSLTCGGSTGREIVRVLKNANSNLGVHIIENIRILRLFKDSRKRVCGAIGFKKEGRKILFLAKAIVLATGGAGRIFKKNVNPPTLEGDGWSMAYQVGAKMVNMEFFQIGPAVVSPKIQFIIHSHLWHLKPKLTNIKGEEFLANYIPLGISPEEVIKAKAMSYPFSVRTIARYLDIAIFKEIMAGRCTANDGIYFDVTHIGEKKLKQLAPITYNALRNVGVDLAHNKIELGLVVQNFNGGILIDENGFTGVEGLYAAGEITGGVHGADRPGGNNLIDTQVFGYRAGVAAANFACKLKNEKYYKPETKDTIFKLDEMNNKEFKKILNHSAEIHYRNSTVVRNAEGLKDTLKFINKYRKNKTQNEILTNRLLVGEIIALSALTREESRGTHYREDFPSIDPFWGKQIIIRQGVNGKLIVRFRKFK
jgi:succinate dehydrogenase/fumarate reductase flavoprotein subunit